MQPRVTQQKPIHRSMLFYFATYAPNLRLVGAPGAYPEALPDNECLQPRALGAQQLGSLGAWKKDTCLEISPLVRIAICLNCPSRE